ncbi:YciI family protein [Mycobacterium sp. BMJ-28]
MSVTSPTTKAHADLRHSGAQKVYFACFTERGQANMEDIQRVIPAHKQWIAEQEAAGRIFIAGPFLTEDFSYAGSGLIVFRAETSEQARLLAQQDPMHAAGLRTFRIVPWQINEGSIRIDLTLSSGAFDFA